MLEFEDESSFKPNPRNFTGLKIMNSFHSPNEKERSLLVIQNNMRKTNKYNSSQINGAREIGSQIVKMCNNIVSKHDKRKLKILIANDTPFLLLVIC